MISVLCIQGIRERRTHSKLFIQLNGGTISINSKDDGINAAQKSSAYRAKAEINGGDITVVMASGDTDAIDSNGDLIINGGTIIVNGQQINYIPNQMMGGGRGGMGGWSRRG